MIRAVDRAQAPGPGDLAIGQMAQDLANAPLVRCRFVLDGLRRKRRQNLNQTRRRGPQNLSGVAAFEQMDVWAGFLFAHAPLDAPWVPVAGSIAVHGLYSPTDHW